MYGRGKRIGSWGEGGCNFKQAFRVGLTKKETVEQRLEEGEGTLWLSEGGTF